ncbi:MAG: hypothetical protein AB7U45_15095 [Desulfamplus sp.]
MKKIILIIVALVILPILALHRDASANDNAALQDDITINEDELFSNPTTVIESNDTNDSDAEKEKKRRQFSTTNEKSNHFGISGEIKHVTHWTIRDKNHLPTQQLSDINPYVDGVLFFDARLPNNIKAFANVEAVYNTDGSNSAVDFETRELFIDLNINKAVYFRTGKQVLQWGRCYLFNPTDLINVEKKTFTEKITAREGTEGIKAHIPFGTYMNMYGFINTYEMDNFDSTEEFEKISGAYKLEFLVDKTEMAFSIWGKKDGNPVYGYDFSTRILGIDIKGEVSASYGDNNKKLIEQDGILYSVIEEDKWIKKCAVDFGKAFDFNNQPDKIQVNLELFYNGSGYDENVFEDNNLYMFDSPVSIAMDSKTGKSIGSSYSGNFADKQNNAALFLDNISLLGGTKTIYMIANGLYEPNYYSEYYAAIFTTVNKFFTSDFSLKANLISNIEQDSFIFTTGVDYKNIKDFKAGISINKYFGADDSEYTFMKNSVDMLITFGITF